MEIQAKIKKWDPIKIKNFQRIKAFNCVDHNKLWKILKEMGILDHLTCPQRSLYVGQETSGAGKTGQPLVKE